MGKGSGAGEVGRAGHVASRIAYPQEQAKRASLDGENGTASATDRTGMPEGQLRSPACF